MAAEQESWAQQPQLRIPETVRTGRRRKRHSPDNSGSRRILVAFVGHNRPQTGRIVARILVAFVGRILVEFAAGIVVRTADRILAEFVVRTADRIVVRNLEGFRTAGRTGCNRPALGHNLRKIRTPDIAPDPRSRSSLARRPPLP